MKFNKCVRCGSFFASDNNVCPNCQSKDEIDKLSLKNYIANHDIPDNIEMLALNSGVSLKNVNRYLQTNDFSDIKKSFDSGNDNNNNIITSL